MKKCLWISVVAMAVSFGVSAHAVTNATFGAWSFETLVNGTAIPSTSSAQLQDHYGSWSSDTNSGNVAYITNAGSVSGTPEFGLPIPDATHTMSLYFSGSVTNHFAASSLNNKRFKTDFLLKPSQLDDLTLANSVESTARLAFYFNTASNLVVLHGSNTLWVTSTVASVSYATNSWLRITIDQDYSVTSVLSHAQSLFRVLVNGTNVTHANGYTRTDNSFASGGGAWFEMKSSGADGSRGMNSLVGMGVGLMDDVVNSEFVFDLNATSAGNGTITPSGALSITNGVNRTFDLLASTGYYVSGLNLNSTQIYTNTDQAIGSVNNLSVTYAQVIAYGTNVQAVFAAKSTKNVAVTAGSGGTIDFEGTTQTITNTLPRDFTLTANNGYYISGLNLGGGSIYVNSSEAVVTTIRTVSYGQVGTSGAVLQPVFSLKATSGWMHSNFSIGSGPGADYATHEEAAADDADHDGFSNEQEAIAGTDPTNAISCLKISSIVVDANHQVSVMFEGSSAGASVPYELWEADTIDGVYSNVASRTKAGGTLGVTNTPSSTPKFYRVEVNYTAP